MLGVFSRICATDGGASLTLDEVLDDHFATIPIPAVYGYSFGHTPERLPNSSTGAARRPKMPGKPREMAIYIFLISRNQISVRSDPVEVSNEQR